MTERASVISVNGVEHAVAADEITPLVDVLRDELGRLEVKIGCREGMCGACTVLLEGLPVPSCLVPLGRAIGRAVTTVTAISGEEIGRRLITAWEQDRASQCGYCTPGLVCSAYALLTDRQLGSSADAALTDGEIRDALRGHLCRCTGYAPIVKAVARADRADRAEAAADAG